MLAQNQYPFPGFPSQFAPSRTARPQPDPGPRASVKFIRASRPIPNEYLIILNDSTPIATVPTVIDSVAKTHGAGIKHIFGTALKGFSAQMSEANAIALSNDPRVKYVEENGLVALFQSPWGLVRMSQLPPVGVDDPPAGLVNGTFSIANDGLGVHVYVIDTGVRISHNEPKNADGTSRASIAWDTVDDDDNPSTPANTDGPGHDGIDCQGHGTLMASIIGGNTFGVAKAATLHSVRSVARDQFAPNPCGGWGDVGELAAGIGWVADHHLSPAVANLSFGCHGFSQTCDDAVAAATAAGVTMVAAVGNDNKSIDPPLPGQPDNRVSPANAPSAIAVGGARSNSTDDRQSDSNYGRRIDVFAAGRLVPGAAIFDANGQFSDSATRTGNGTSVAAPHVAGVAAVYLHDHVSGTASLPWVVKQVLTSNANVCSYDATGCIRVGNRPSGSGTPDRLLYSSFLQTPANPIYNHRFFVWQQYRDFLAKDPDETGLDYWTRNITGSCNGATKDDNIAGVNGNNDCTRAWRVNTSLAFWVDSSNPNGSHPGWFDSNGVLVGTNNDTFLTECYNIYLQRPGVNLNNDPDGGFLYWHNYLNASGNPATYDRTWHLMQAFLEAWDYESRFGPHS